MKYLALDTSGQSCSVALEVDGRRSQSLDTVGRQHARQLPDMVQTVLADAGLGLRQIDGLICCVGPGSFAGVRVGVAYAKGLALGLDVPIAAVSSLALLAEGARKKHGAQRVLAALDARMGEIYVGDYRCQRNGMWTADEERVCPPDQIQFASDAAQPCVGVGSGWQRYETELRAAGNSCGAQLEVDTTAFPEAQDAFDIVAAQDPGIFVSAVDLQPSYLRNQVAKTVEERARDNAATQ